jgi:hypothetical protein
MTPNYIQTVRLLLDIAPAIFTSSVFAMKGGTALNLFVQDMHQTYARPARARRPSSSSEAKTYKSKSKSISSFVAPCCHVSSAR